MSEMGEEFRDMRKDRAELRRHFGVPCPECVEKLPKAQPSILLPQQQCRIHGYKDARPRITNDDRISVGCTFLQVERAK